MNTRKRNSSKRKLPKHVPLLAREVANYMMQRYALNDDGHVAMPYQLARKFGLSFDEAVAVQDLQGHGFGPGGAGVAWVEKETERIIQRQREEP